MKSRGGILIGMGMSFAILTGLQIGPFMKQSMSFAADITKGPSPEAPVEAPSSLDRPTTTDKDTCFTEALAQRLWADSEAIEARQLLLDERENTLRQIELDVQTKLTAIEATKQQMEAIVDRLEQESTDDIDRLVTMYSTMKPTKAADIFDRMDPTFSAGLLRQMEPNRAGMIMAEMGAEKSYRTSLLIANRNAAWRAKG